MKKEKQARQKVSGGTVNNQSKNPVEKEKRWPLVNPAILPHDEKPDSHKYPWPERELEAYINEVVPRKIEHLRRCAGWDRSAASKSTGLKRRMMLLGAKEDESEAQVLEAALSSKDKYRAVCKIVARQQAVWRVADYRGPWDKLENSRLKGLDFDSIAEWLKIRDATLRNWLRTRRGKRPVTAKGGAR